MPRGRCERETIVATIEITITLMQARNIDFDTSLTLREWEQLALSIASRADHGVADWTPTEPDVIRLSIREGDYPEGWDGIVPPLDDLPPEEREVARIVFNDGRPYAHLEPPRQPERPVLLPQDDERMQLALEKWVREKWHELLRFSGLRY